MSPTKKSEFSQNETRKVARIMFSTIKKIGSFKGGSLKKIYEYIKAEYPSSKKNILKLRKTLERALASEGVNKKNGITLHGAPVVVKSLKHRKQDGIIEVKRRSSRKKRRRRGRSPRRSKGGGKSAGRKSNNRAECE